MLLLVMSYDELWVMISLKTALPFTNKFQIKMFFIYSSIIENVKKCNKEDLFTFSLIS